MTKNQFNYFLVALIFILDQSTKFLARKYLEAREPIEIWTGHIRLQLVHNTGAFLSMGAEWPGYLRWTVLIAFVFFFLFFLWRLMIKESSTPKQKTCYAIVLGGGLGNLLDRLLMGEVTDFLWLGAGPVQTGVFNLADVAILFGILVLLLEVHPKNNKDVV